MIFSSHQTCCACPGLENLCDAYFQTRGFRREHHNERERIQLRERETISLRVKSRVNVYSGGSVVLYSRLQIGELIFVSADHSEITILGVNLLRVGSRFLRLSRNMEPEYVSRSKQGDQVAFHAV